nr:PAS domain S-box protein [Chthoniobacterales bacterium]
MTNQRIMGHGPGGSEDRFQGPRIRKDGSLFEADVVLTALRDAHGTVRGFSKVTRDVTDQVRIRQ